MAPQLAPIALRSEALKGPLRLPGLAYALCLPRQVIGEHQGSYGFHWAPPARLPWRWDLRPWPVDG
jgi:hypothetical protein